MMNNSIRWQSFWALVARAAIAVLFIVSGANKLLAPAETLEAIRASHLMLPYVSLVVAVIIELGGGILLLIGWGARYAAFIMALFVLVVTGYFHLFWLYTDPESAVQMQMFLKNLAIFGGLLYIWAFGPGRFSIDGQSSSATGE